MSGSPPLNLQHLETLLAVLSTGSFHGAGRRLGLAQPTVSQHVRKLEARLRATLVERGPTGCHPTPQGRALLPYVEALLRMGRRAEESVGGGRLAVGASGNVGTYLLPDLLHRHEAAGAGPTQVEVGTNPHIRGLLKGGEIDLALMEWWEPLAGFAATAWRCEPLVVIVGPDHAWAQWGSVPPEALAGASLLGGEPGSGTGRVLRATLGAIGAGLGVARQLGSTEAVKRAVRARLGISIVMACAVRDEVCAGDLIALPMEGVELAKTLFAAHPDPLPATAPAHAFVATLGALS